MKIFLRIKSEERRNTFDHLNSTVFLHYLGMVTLPFRKNHLRYLISVLTKNLLGACFTRCNQNFENSFKNNSLQTGTDTQTLRHT